MADEPAAEPAPAAEALVVDAADTAAPPADGGAEGAAALPGSVPDGWAGDGVELEEPADASAGRRTAVQPKKVTEETVYRNAEQDVVRHAFHPGSYVGIRSLPNALGPAFRQQFYEGIRSARGSKGETGRGGNPQKPTRLCDSERSTEVAAGQRKPGKFSPAPRVFSLYDYKESEYDRERALRAEEARQSKARWMDGEKRGIKVTALPPVPQSAGSFNVFEYSADPYELKEEAAKAEKEKSTSLMMGPPMRAAGKASVSEQRKASVWDSINQLTAVLRADWPACFARVVEDEIGCLACCFDKASAGDAGDVTTYMNHMFRTNETVNTFNLKKDPTRWGITERADPSVYYVFVPPWVHYVVPVDLDLPKAARMPPEPALVSGRVPFGPQTVGGNAVHVHVRTFSRSFKY